MQNLPLDCVVTLGLFVVAVYFKFVQPRVTQVRGAAQDTQSVNIFGFYLVMLKAGAGVLYLFGRCVHYVAYYTARLTIGFSPRNSLELEPEPRQLLFQEEVWCIMLVRKLVEEEGYTRSDIVRLMGANKQKGLQFIRKAMKESEDK